ncbi:unnamed protein product [Amoebophrya sp. A120]|nr:unnamed protein product [Amoebophrya sp. A120]|eukprot:GSA120T00022879001.1
MNKKPVFMKKMTVMKKMSMKMVMKKNRATLFRENFKELPLTERKQLKYKARLLLEKKERKAEEEAKKKNSGAAQTYPGPARERAAGFRAGAPGRAHARGPRCEPYGPAMCHRPGHSSGAAWCAGRQPNRARLAPLFSRHPPQPAALLAGAPAGLGFFLLYQHPRGVRGLPACFPPGPGCRPLLRIYSGRWRLAPMRADCVPGGLAAFMSCLIAGPLAV